MQINVTISSGQSLSGALDIGGINVEIIGIVMPVAWTAANLTFQVSADGTTFQNLYDDGGNELMVAAGAGRTIGLHSDVSRALGRFRYLKVRSGTSGTPVNQAADRTITLYARAKD